MTAETNRHSNVMLPVVTDAGPLRDARHTADRKRHAARQLST